MKMIYETPKMEVIAFQAGDVIATSTDLSGLVSDQDTFVGGNLF